MSFKSEVAGIKQVHLRLSKVAPIGVSTRRNESRIIFPPGGQKWRLPFPEVSLEGWVKRNVAPIIKDQIELNFFSSRPRHIRDVKRITVWRNPVAIGAMQVLPLAN